MSKMEKVLGMLGSSHAGERASAALIISKMAKERGLTIVELLRREFGPKPSRPHREPPADRPHTYNWRKPVDDVDDSERTLINSLLRCRSMPLSRQERTFVYDTIMKKQRDSDLTPSERRTAEVIIARYFREDA